jgi:excinuclease UvrABC nuclease subunit
MKVLVEKKQWRQRHKATETLRVNKNNKENLVRKAKELPARPGCYIFKDAAGNILYVGKSKCLNKRVASYFGKQKEEKFAIMMKFAVDVEHICADTDIEAILLEHRLIKLHQPLYNSKMRKEKERWYITLNEQDEFSYVFITDEPKESVLNIGPFSRIEYAEETLASLGDYFKIPTCGYSGGSAKTPCLRHHINKCFAICRGGFNKKEYENALENFVEFARGNTSETLRNLKARIQEAADTLNFELAARLRNQYESLYAAANNWGHIPPNLHEKEYFVKIKSHHEEGFLLIHLKNKIAACMMRVSSPPEYEARFKMLVNHVNTGEIPRGLPHGDFRVLNGTEGRYIAEAVLEVDATRRFAECAKTKPP